MTTMLAPRIWRPELGEAKAARPPRITPAHLHDWRVVAHLLGGHLEQCLEKDCKATRTIDADGW